jgi:pimeloyl-ACP methyl ester carboxylesterase
LVSVVLVLGGCATSQHVHSTRADPVGSAPPITDAPGDSTGTTEPNGSTDTSEPNNTTTPQTAALEWHECDDPSADDPSLSCSTITVPLDYDNPNGETVTLALVRVPATDDRKGAVLFNPGGPGGSGFDYIAIGGTSIVSALGLESFDLIGFDPRGVDRSNGIRCVSDEFQDQHLYVDPTPDTPAEQQLADEAKTGFVDGCKEKYGDTLRYYNTVNTARDMDAIRAALGDEQITFLGASYGTYLGAVYATMFPDRVRAMALDSVFEPNGDTIEQQYETQLVGFEGAFNNWAAWCQSNSTCQFTAADVPARWDALRQRFDDEPVTAPDGRVVNNALFELATKAALYSESDWPVLGEALANAEAGDVSGLLALADAYSGRNEDGTYNTITQSFPVLSCASGITPDRPDDPAALAAELRALAPRFGADITAETVLNDSDQCSALVGDVSPEPLSYSGDGPIVLVGGENDPATPIRWAHEMAAELGPNARLVTFTGEGHGQLGANTCVTNIEGALLADLSLPDPDTVCDPDPVVPRPEWWDTLPVPEGFSDVVALPAVAASIGAGPTQVFSEMRTTTLSPEDAINAYTQALTDEGLGQFDIPPVLPFDDVAQGAYTDFGGRALIIVAMGPKAFDDKLLQSAKVEVPPNTTVVALIAVPT